MRPTWIPLQELVESENSYLLMKRSSLRKLVFRLSLPTVFSAVLLFALYWLGLVQLNHPSLATYPVRGIDVSHHQGAIEWPRIVSESEIAFAYIKASEGGTLRDPRFKHNWEASSAIARGAYHFFTFCTDGQAQAKNFLEVAPTDGDLPAAVDIEFGGNCRSWTSIEDIRAELAEFLSILEAQYSRRPVLYVTRKSYGRIIRGPFDSYPLWVRETVVHPPADLYGDWLFWQYAGNGRMSGIDPRVDLNVFRRGSKEFKQLVSVGP